MDKSGKWPKKRLELWRFVGPEGSAEVRLFKGWTEAFVVVCCAFVIS